MWHFNTGVCSNGLLRTAMILCGTILISAAAKSQECPPADLCRDGGNLVHAKNRAESFIYTVRCSTGKGETPPGEWSNGSPRRLDRICHEISTCPAAGSFGRFLGSVTGNCMEKHFDGYFGLDGLTFGILDFTSPSLPAVVQTYEERSPGEFRQHLGSLSLPLKDGCWATSDICSRNRTGAFMCKADFHTAFKATVQSAEFQKAEAAVALKAYDERIARFAGLGLKTEYGIVAMATVENGLKGSPACHPAAWKKTCAAATDEAVLVHCMLDQYVIHQCRGGSPQAAAERRDDINRTFAGSEHRRDITPSLDQVLACSTSWGADE